MSDIINILKDYWWLISTFILPFATYLVGIYKVKNKEQEVRLKKIEEGQEIRADALKVLLQNELTNIFYKYIDTGGIPSHVYKNWINMLTSYENLGGNDYIHELALRIKNLKIIKK